ncbi:unnamed protein product [Bubo scandiacus]
MKMYLQGLEHSKMSQGPVPDRRKLMHVKNDLKRVLKVCPYLRTNLDTGQETLTTEYFKWAIDLDNAGFTKSLQCLPEPLLVLFGQMKLRQKIPMQEVERQVK